MVDWFAASKYCEIKYNCIFENKIAPAAEFGDWPKKLEKKSWNSGTVLSTETANHIFENLKKKKYNGEGREMLIWR